MKKFTKIVNEIKSSPESDLTYLNDKKYDEFLETVWEFIKKENQKEIEELKQNLGEELYSKLEEYVKDRNSEYYSFAYFRDKNVDMETRKALMNAFYERVIITSNYRSLESYINKRLDEEEIDDIISVLHSVTDFCIYYNRSGNYLAEIFVDTYEIDKDIVEGLIQMYDTNKLSLKLDYLIKRTNRKR